VKFFSYCTACDCGEGKILPAARERQHQLTTQSCSARHLYAHLENQYGDEIQHYDDRSDYESKVSELDDPKTIRQSLLPSFNQSIVR
jgi:hypothetical protein